MQTPFLSMWLLYIVFRILKEALTFRMSLHLLLTIHVSSSYTWPEKNDVTSEQRVHPAFFGFIRFYAYFCKSGVVHWKIPITFEKLSKELLYFFSIAFNKTLGSTVVLSLFLLYQISLFMSGFLSQCQSKHSPSIACILLSQLIL